VKAFAELESRELVAPWKKWRLSPEGFFPPRRPAEMVELKPSKNSSEKAGLLAVNGWINKSEQKAGQII
jgi:hypothetical protein